MVRVYRHMVRVLEALEFIHGPVNINCKFGALRFGPCFVVVVVVAVAVAAADAEKGRRD